MLGIILCLGFIPVLTVQACCDAEECRSSAAPADTNCGCDMGCDSTGACISATASCKSYRFGPLCLYDDLTVRGKIQAHPDQSLSWVTDHDKQTCNEEPDLQWISVSWDNLPYSVKWLWLHVKNTLYEKDGFKVQITDEDGVNTTCPNMKTGFVHSNTIEMHCTFPDKRAQNIRLMGDAITNLCGLKINGGRELSLKRQTQQSSTSGLGRAELAVDGNLNTSLNGEYCSHANGTQESIWWKVILDVPSFVYRIVVITIGDQQNYLQNYQIALESSQSNTYEYRFTKECLLYDVTNTPATLPVTEVLIIQHTEQSNAPLILCEVMVFGEPACPPTKFGMTCEKTCKCAKGGQCFGITGMCPDGCLPGWSGDGCSSECPDGTYGRNCEQNCSAKCILNPDGSADSICDPKNGECLRGCSIGYQPPTCQDECPMGKHGQDCKETCSQNCEANPDGVEDAICDHETGSCLHGCQLGYQEPYCDKECPHGTYGRNCVHKCSANCKLNPDCVLDSICDPKNGACLHKCTMGYQPPACQDACPSGKYGQDCKETCSRNCDANPNGAEDAICNHENGACRHGCQLGYQGSTCNKGCLRGTHGKNCAQNCSANCNFRPDGVADSICDPKSGDCLNGCTIGYNLPTCHDECPPWTYGMNCMTHCSDFCDTSSFDPNKASCHHKTGTCVEGCIAGYQPPRCVSACPPGSFGKDCLHKCSDKCAPIPKDSTAIATCNHVNGACFGGCIGGYEPPNCEAVCPPGTFGKNCTQHCSEKCVSGNSTEKSTCDPVSGDCLACPHGIFGKDCMHRCSENCARISENNTQNSACNLINGSCSNGCVDGYAPPNCEAACPPGTFGMNCRQNCSEKCVELTDNSTMTSSCDSMSGICLGGCVSGYVPPMCEAGVTAEESRGWYTVPLYVVVGVVLTLLLCSFTLCNRPQSKRAEPDVEQENFSADYEPERYSDESVDSSDSHNESV